MEWKEVLRFPLGVIGLGLHMCCFSACTATLKFHHTQDVCCMPTALTDTFVSVAYQHLEGSPTWWLMMAAWVMNWVIWHIYEWCLLCHGGAVLRGGRKPIAELPNVGVQTAWWLPSSTSRSMTGRQWNRRSFFHFHHWVIWTDEAWGMNLGYMGNLWLIFAISLRSCTERYGGHLFVVLLHHRGVVLSGTHPRVWLNTTCHVGDYNLGSCGTSMRDCYFFAEQWEAWRNFWKRSVSLLLGVLFVFGFVCFVVLCLVFVWWLWHLGYCLTFWKRQSK